MANEKKTPETTTEEVKVGTFTKKVAKPQPVTKETALKTKDVQPFVPSQDAVENKKYAWWAYILFFIPLLLNSQSPFVRHHANEGLEINIFDAVGLILLLIGALAKPAVASWHALLIIFVLLGSGLLILTTITKIYMIYSTLKGKETTTPWMWDLRIIK
jgi:hypothetical protein